MIEIKNVFIAYQDKAVLSSVSFSIEQGEIVGLYGANGSGKTSLSQVIAGIKKPQLGKVYIDGKEMNKPGRIQLIFQQPEHSFDPSQKFINSFEEVIRYHKLAKGKEEKEKLIDEVCKQVEIKRDLLFHYPHQISGGEAERIALARALLLKPSLIILDEATSMLDVLNQSLIIELIKKIAKEQHISFLYIAHDRRVLEQSCTKIYQIKNRNIHLQEEKHE